MDAPYNSDSGSEIILFFTREIIRSITSVLFYIEENFQAVTESASSGLSNSWFLDFIPSPPFASEMAGDVFFLRYYYGGICESAKNPRRFLKNIFSGLTPAA